MKKWLYHSINDNNDGKINLNLNPKWITYEQYAINLKEIIKENSTNIEDNNI